MLPDRVLNPGPLTYESGALMTALCGPANLYCLSFLTKSLILKASISHRYMQKLDTDNSNISNMISQSTLLYQKI